jgi:branched-chain amino acid transport system permease protein
VFKATSVVNFGQGDFLMAGAFAIYVLTVLLGVPFLPAAILGTVILCALGMAMERWLIRPIRSGPHLSIAMMALAGGYFLRGGATLVWGREILPFPPVYPDRVFLLGDTVLTSNDIVIVGGVVLLVIALTALFLLTPIGRTAQAVFQSPRGALLVGIDVNGFQGFTWGLGAAMAAIGGILIAPVTLLYPDMAAFSLIRGFAAMTLGGFGSFPGALIGGFLLGVTEMLVGGYVGSDYVDITPYLAIILVLLLRPTGLLGRATLVRV